MHSYFMHGKSFIFTSNDYKQTESLKIEKCREGFTIYLFLTTKQISVDDSMPKQHTLITGMS